MANCAINDMTTVIERSDNAMVVDCESINGSSTKNIELLMVTDYKVL